MSNSAESIEKKPPMFQSAEGIVENAAIFTGTVRSRIIRIHLIDHIDEPISNTKCKLTFKDGQTILVNSDDEGTFEFVRKSPGEINIEILEIEETNNINDSEVDARTS